MSTRSWLAAAFHLKLRGRAGEAVASLPGDGSPVRLGDWEARRSGGAVSVRLHGDGNPGGPGAASQLHALVAAIADGSGR